jgi:hypothetical protein
MTKRKQGEHSPTVEMKDLSELQIQFCHAYTASNGNLSKACQKVNIARNTAYGYLEKEHVKNYLEILTQLGVKEDIATTEELLEILSGIARGTIKDEIYDFKSSKVVEVLPSGLTRTGAIQLILKQRGELVNKVSFEATVYDSPKPLPMDLKALADTKRKEKLLPPIDVDVEVIDDGE